MRLLVIGAGGHAKVVVEVARAAGWTVVGTVDDEPGRQVLDVPPVGRPDDLAAADATHAVVAVGSNVARQQLATRLAHRLDWATVIHPSAVVSPSARVGAGAVVFAGVVVQAESVVGPHAILNTGCRVDHDCTVGAFAHVGPGAILAGSVTLDEGAFVGAGAVVTPGRHVGAWAVLGAGAVAIQDLEDGTVSVGVPARPTQARKEPT